MNWQNIQAGNQLRQMRKEQRELLDKIETLQDFCMEAITHFEQQTSPEKHWIYRVKRYIDG